MTVKERHKLRKTLVLPDVCFPYWVVIHSFRITWYELPTISSSFCPMIKMLVEAFSGIQGFFFLFVEVPKHMLWSFVSANLIFSAFLFLKIVIIFSGNLFFSVFSNVGTLFSNVFPSNGILFTGVFIIVGTSFRNVFPIVGTLFFNVFPSADTLFSMSNCRYSSFESLSKLHYSIFQRLSKRQYSILQCLPKHWYCFPTFFQAPVLYSSLFSERRYIFQCRTEALRNLNYICYLFSSSICLQSPPGIHRAKPVDYQCKTDKDYKT